MRVRILLKKEMIYLIWKIFLKVKIYKLNKNFKNCNKYLLQFFVFLVILKGRNILKG